MSGEFDLKHLEVLLGRLTQDTECMQDFDRRLEDVEIRLNRLEDSILVMNTNLNLIMERLGIEED